MEKFYVEKIQCLEMQDAHLAETQQSLRLIRPEHQQRQRQDQQSEGGENFDHHVDRKTGWRYCREPRGNPQAAPSSSTSQWANFIMANELELMAFLHRLRNGGDFGFLDGIPEKRREGVDRTPTHNTHLCSTVWFTCAERTQDALDSSIALPSLCAKISVVIWCGQCLIHGCSLTRIPP